MTDEECSPLTEPALIADILAVLGERLERGGVLRLSDEERDSAVYALRLACRLLRPPHEP